MKPFETRFWPQFFRRVIIAERWRSLRQLQPFRFPSSVDVNVRLQSIWIVQRADAHKPEIRPAAVITPDGRLAFGTTVNVVSTILARHRDGYWLAAKQLNGRSLNDCVEYEGAACQPLAIVAVTAMDEHRFYKKLIADRAARAPADEFFCHF